LDELAVAQAGLGHLGLQAVVVLFGSHRKSPAILHQRGQPVAGHGHAVALGFQLGRVRRFQILFVLLVAGGLLLGQKFLGFVFIQAAHGGAADLRSAGSAAGSSQ
jgi:hypothetical protein